MVVIGNWNQFQTSKGCRTGCSPKIIVKAFQERGVKVFKMDEYNTSKLCHKHIMESEQMDETSWKTLFVENPFNNKKYELNR